MSYVYALIDPRNNLPFYIGKGVNRRCYFHLWEARNTDSSTPKLNKIRKIEKLGLSVAIKKYDENISDDKAKEFECFLISELTNFGIKLTNLTSGGDGVAGYKRSLDVIAKTKHIWTDEQKKKISESLTGEKHPFFGKPCSEQRRQAIIKATTGIKKSTTEKMKKPKKKEKCIYCGIWASGGNLKRWHMDNCKRKSNVCS